MEIHGHLETHLETTLKACGCNFVGHVGIDFIDIYPFRFPNEYPQDSNQIDTYKIINQNENKLILDREQKKD